MTRYWWREGRSKTSIACQPVCWSCPRRNPTSIQTTELSGSAGLPGPDRQYYFHWFFRTQYSVAAHFKCAIFWERGTEKKPCNDHFCAESLSISFYWSNANATNVVFSFSSKSSLTRVPCFFQQFTIYLGVLVGWCDTHVSRPWWRSMEPLHERNKIGRWNVQLG